jgi:hypothetical protein
MTTKAEEFKYWQQRSGPKKAKRAKVTPRGRDGRESLHAGRNAAYVLEDSAGKPSRRSTRKSSNRQKTDSQTRAKRWTAEVRPEGRVGRAR